MQRLGLVLSVTPSRNIITKSEKPPKIGVDVVDEGLKIVGKIFDIIGPTSSPYIVVRPEITDPQRLMGKKLYMTLSRTRRRSR